MSIHPEVLTTASSCAAAGGRRDMLPLLHAVCVLAVVAPAQLNLRTLLSTCCDASARGCTEIRSVQERRDAGYALSVGLKVIDDPRSALTEADAAAQQAIIGALRQEWPGLRIVGEEEERPLPPADGVLRHDLCTAFDSDATADIADITIFVDPLDGTREFVEGRLQNCQTLVGVSVRGRAVAGAIGVPFPAGDLSVDSTVVYGLVGAGVGTLGPDLPQPFISRDSSLPRPHVVTGDSTPPIMAACLDAVLASGGSRIVTGGAGNKILAAAIGDVDVAIQHKYGGPWDVCASEAVLTAMGGRLTDLFGHPIAIYGDQNWHADSLLSPVPSDRCNALGFVVTGPRSAISHLSLVSKLRAMPSLMQYREELSAEGARAKRTATVSLADMPCVCQSDAGPTLVGCASEAFAELGGTLPARRAVEARRLLLNGRVVTSDDASVKVGDTLELLPTCEDVEADTVWPSETLLSPQLAADEWSALRDFVVRGQRALAPDVPDLDVDVVACASLADFLRARPTLERASSGGLRATVHSFLEPAWGQSEHLSGGGTPLLFSRDATLDEAADAPPALALKLIRREALEEMHSGADLEDGAATTDAGRSGPGGGDVDVARTFNELALAWARERLPGQSSQAVILAADDRVLDGEGATTRFVQSRLELTKSGDDLIVRGPSLATPISGRRAPGTGCSFCKVLPPESALASLLALRGGMRMPRCGTPRMGLFDSASKAFSDFVWPSSLAVADTVESICDEGGWDVRCTLGQQAASSLRSRVEDHSGAPLSAAMQDSAAGDVELKFSVAFDLEPEGDPGSRSRTQGAARLLSESRFLSVSPETGSWMVPSRDDDEVPTAVRWCLRCAEITVGGDTLVPEGTTLYFTALTSDERRQRGIDLGNCRVSIREDSSMLSALFGTRGIEQFAEYKTIGRFEIKRRGVRDL